MKTTKPKTEKRIVLIDADTIIYAQSMGAEICLRGQAVDGGDQWLQTKTVDEVYDIVVSRFEEIVTATEADDAIICLSDRNNFRHSILPTYKANRHAVRRPPLLTAVRETLQERKPFPVMCVETLEADDVCGIAAGSLRTVDRQTIIASPDKDLKTIPGLYYSCRPGAEVEIISEHEADRHHLYQTLVGDTTDNYTGCPKVGPVKANAILDRIMDLPPVERWNKIVDEFVSRGFTAEYALTQARTARILRDSDWDAKSREVILWSPA